MVASFALSLKNDTKSHVNIHSGQLPTSSFASNQSPAEDHPVQHKESSEIPAPQPEVVTSRAFEELRQQVATLTQLLGQ